MEEESNINGNRLFVIKKNLSSSDLDRNQNRLRLSKESVETDLLPKLSEWEREEVKTEEGLQLVVLDELGREYSMCLKTWNKGKFYVINGKGWKEFLLANEMEIQGTIEVSGYRPSAPEQKEDTLLPID